MFLVPYVAFLFILILTFSYRKIPILKNIKIYNVIEKIPDFYIFNFLVVITIITQFYTINIETLSWDVNTYLVMGQDVARGNLPYEYQFDNKGPFFYFIYSLPARFSKIYAVKIFNDLILSILVCQMYLIAKRLRPSLYKIFHLIPPLYFSFYLSYPQGHSGMSEIYCLIFIAFGIIFALSPKPKSFQYLIIGFLFSVSYLLSPSVVLLISGISILIIIKILKQKRYKQLFNFAIGALLPLLTIVVIYASNDLLFELIYTLFIFPVIYTTKDKSTDYFSFFEHLTEYLFLENYIGLGLITSFIFLLIIIFFPKNLKTLMKFNEVDFKENIFFLLVLLSIITFFNVSVPWWHYLIYYFFFSSFILLFIDSYKLKNGILFLILLCSLNILPFMIRDGIKLISNSENIETSYPIYSDFIFISNNYEVESIVALNNQLILYYFNLPASNYMVHPSNYQKKSYMEGLTEAGLLKENELENLIKLGSSDLLICNPIYLEQCKDSDYYDYIFESSTGAFYFINKKTISK